MRDVTLSVDLPHPPALVWRCLTEPELLARWLAPTDLRPEVGARFTLQMPAWPGWDGRIAGEILAVDPERHLSYTWEGSAMGAPTTVSWRLTPIAGGTRLHLDHTGFRSLFMRLIHALGWRPRLARSLRPVLDAAFPSPPRAPVSPIHWPAVAVAFVFDAILGALWYGPLFGTLWFTAQGLDPATEISSAVYGLSTVANLVKVICVAAVVARTRPRGIADGIQTTGLIWLGAVVVLHLGGTLFSGRSLTVLGINMAFHAVAFAGFGALFGGWRRRGS